MILAVSLMIGSYIFTRCVEMAIQNRKEGGSLVVVILAVFTMLLTVINVLAVAFSPARGNPF